MTRNAGKALPAFLAGTAAVLLAGMSAGPLRAQASLSDSHTASPQPPPDAATTAPKTLPVESGKELAQDAAAHGLKTPHWAVLEKYCITCHNVEDWAGGVAFDAMNAEQIPQDAKVWEEAVRKLRGHLMPPPGKDRPDNASLKSLVGWLENTLDEGAKGHIDPGRVPLHRLNRKEYANAIRDLLDLEVDGTALLPRDDSRDGFDNVAAALQVSPSFLDQYISAARTVAVQAIGNRQARPVGITYNASGGGTQQFHRDGLPFGTRGGAVVDHYFPADGEYALNIGNMAQALWVYNMEFENTLVATLDGKEIFRTVIGGDADQKSIDQKQDPAVDAINKRLKDIRFQATAGTHKVGVTFVHRTFAESEDRLQIQSPGGGQDRVLRVNTFEVRGPFRTTGISATPSRERIFVCYPQSAAEEQPCAQQVLSTLARRAYRRAPTEPEIAGLMKFYAVGRKDGDFDAGVRRGLTAILADPDFLYRADAPPSAAAQGALTNTALTRTAAAAPEPAPGMVYALSDIELASRLSFFLWSSLPDDELLDLAAKNQLHEPQVFEKQVKRLLADPRSESLVTNFAFQWLNIAKLDEIDPDPKIFPYASGAGDPRHDFRDELRLFIDSVFREDRSVLDLLTADYTYMNERLALHYGIQDVKGDQFRRVALKDSARYGLLGKGAVLMLTSYPNRTGPVLRGAWILERITGTPPSPPPPNVEALKDNEAGKPASSVRDLMAKHSHNPSCFSCHGVMDPLGFALENFDAVGQWRSIDRFARTKIDSTGKLPDGTLLNGPDDLRKALIADPSQFVQTLTEKLMTYALGRPVDYRDMPMIRAMVRDAAKHDYRFSALVMGVVTSDAFRKRSAPADGASSIKTAAVTGR